MKCIFEKKTEEIGFGGREVVHLQWISRNLHLHFKVLKKREIESRANCRFSDFFPLTSRDISKNPDTFLLSKEREKTYVEPISVTTITQNIFFLPSHPRQNPDLNYPREEKM